MNDKREHPDIFKIFTSILQKTRIKPLCLLEKSERYNIMFFYWNLLIDIPQLYIEVLSERWINLSQFYIKIINKHGYKFNLYDNVFRNYFVLYKRTYYSLLYLVT